MIRGPAIKNFIVKESMLLKALLLENLLLEALLIQIVLSKALLSETVLPKFESRSPQQQPTSSSKSNTCVPEDAYTFGPKLVNLNTKRLNV